MVDKRFSAFRYLQRERSALYTPIGILVGVRFCHGRWSLRKWVSFPLLRHKHPHLVVSAFRFAALAPVWSLAVFWFTYIGIILTNFHGSLWILLLFPNKLFVITACLLWDSYFLSIFFVIVIAECFALFGSNWQTDYGTWFRNVKRCMKGGPETPWREDLCGQLEPHGAIGNIKDRI